MTRKAERPEPSKQLFESVFEGFKPESVLRTISQGLIAFLENATRLTEDMLILMKAERFSTAKFLLTTTNEEMAKTYILLDACRLDFSRHASTLQRLCRAFYDHVSKYAYNEIINSHTHIRNMEQVKIFWESETTKWWPSSDPESGEPDMPHETYFSREMPLYVDFIEYDQKWHKPENAITGATLSLEKMRFKDTQEGLKRLQQTFESGLYNPEGLTILNNNFKKHYITEKTSSEEIQRLYEKTAQQMEQELSIKKEMFFESALHEWPLYHFTTLD
jgi:AbiV family abortive infection protein